MFYPLRFGRIAIVSFMTVCGLLFLPRPSFGKVPGVNRSVSSNCDVDDFETKLQFFNGPGDYFKIAVYMRNIADHPCDFNGDLNGAPGFVPDRVEGHEPVKICFGCEERPPDGSQPRVTLGSLEPGQVARQIYRWHTTPQSAAVPCLQPKWMSGTTLIIAPSLIKPVCSEVEVSRFTLAPAEENSDPGDRKLQLTADRNEYYEGESIALHVSGAGAGLTESPEKDGCPSLFLWQRSPDGATRLDEVQPYAFKGCKPVFLGHELGDWRSGFELDSGANSRWLGAGEHTLQIFQLAGSEESAEINFNSSSELRLKIANPANIPRKWGARVRGIAADITLNKDTFRVGEDVPLHIAIENFDADVPVYSADPVWDPCGLVGIEVRDSGGRPLSESERLPMRSVCMGNHGFGPKPYEKGKVVALERSLGAEQWLPNHPGTYTVVVTWTPCTGPEGASKFLGSTSALKPYAVAHAEATIHVFASENSRAN